MYFNDLLVKYIVVSCSFILVIYINSNQICSDLISFIETVTNARLHVHNHTDRKNNNNNIFII
jgi:hypothetical protein